MQTFKILLLGLLASAVILALFRLQVAASIELSYSFFFGITILALLTFAFFIKEKLRMPPKFLALLLVIVIVFMIIRIPLVSPPSFSNHPFFCNVENSAFYNFSFNRYYGFKEVCNAKNLTYTYIMDEYSFIPAAQYLLSGAKCLLAPNMTVMTPCQLEHPPLGELLIAGGMVIFGNAPLGWRFSSFFFGTLLIPLIFLLAYAVSKSYRIAILTAFLTVIDTTILLHSSLALLEIPGMFFGMAGITYFVFRWKQSSSTTRKFTDLLVTSLLIALGVLVMVSITFFAIFLVLYYILSNIMNRKSERPNLKEIAMTSALLLILPAIFFVIGVSIFGYFSMSAFSNPLANVGYMLSFYLSSPIVRIARWPDIYFNTTITPFNWLSYYTAYPYFIGTKGVWGPFTHVYLGTTNMIEVWIFFVFAVLLLWDVIGKRQGTRQAFINRCLKLLLFSVIAASILVTIDPSMFPFIVGEVGGVAPGFLTGETISTFLLETAFVIPFFFLVLITLQFGLAHYSTKVRAKLSENRAGAFAFLFFIVNYFAFFLLYIKIRTTFPFFAIQMVPAVALGVACLLEKQRKLTIPVVIAATAWFVYFYLIAI